MNLLKNKLNFCWIESERKTVDCVSDDRLKYCEQQRGEN